MAGGERMLQRSDVREVHIECAAEGRGAQHIVAMLARAGFCRLQPEPECRPSGGLLAVPSRPVNACAHGSGAPAAGGAQSSAWWCVVRKHLLRAGGHGTYCADGHG